MYLAVASDSFRNGALMQDRRVITEYVEWV